MSVAIEVTNISKQYRLGQIGTGSISHDFNRWWHTVRGKEDPYLKIGETNDRTKAGNSEYVWSLKDINFKIEQGDAVGIIGRNGAGKSTLLKILSRVTTPTTGTVKAKGRIASLLEVGTGFHPELSGRENIFLNGAILGMRKHEIEKHFDEIVDFAGVERYIDTPVKRYSSGMYVRLAFAVAAYLESEILIVDEVLAVGDAEFQKKCLGKMSDVSKGEGRTVLFVSHNMAAVLNLCQICISMDQGFIKMMNNTEVVVSDYMKGEKSLSSNINFLQAGNLCNKGMPCFRLMSFYFNNLPKDDGTIKATENKIIEIIIKGEFHNPNNLFNIGYALKNEFGDTVIISFSTDQPEANWISQKQGFTTIRTFIDTSVLNEGKYHVYLLASLHCIEMIYTEEDNIRLDFEIMGNRGKSPYWFSKRNTFIAPFTKWENIN